MSGRVAELEAENQALRDRIEVLERDRGLDWRSPVEWRLTSIEDRIFGVIFRRERVSKWQIMDAIYAGRNQEPDVKTIDVHVCRVRAKLKPLGIEIETLFGEGLRIAPESKARVRELVGVASREAEAPPTAARSPLPINGVGEDADGGETAS